MSPASELREFLRAAPAPAADSPAPVTAKAEPASPLPSSAYLLSQRRLSYKRRKSTDVAAMCERFTSRFNGRLAILAVRDILPLVVLAALTLAVFSTCAGSNEAPPDGFSAALGGQLKARGAALLILVAAPAPVLLASATGLRVLLVASTAACAGVPAPAPRGSSSRTHG